MADRQHDAAVDELDAVEWTDRQWDDVWERGTAQTTRHRLAMALLRREQPSDPIARRLQPELARRWRRAGAVYAFWWGLFTAFWVTIGVSAESGPEPVALVTPWWMALLGTTIVLVALGIRAWIRDAARDDRRVR